jgi:RimJ/RimL family protein N-acetyltransferase
MIKTEFMELYEGLSEINSDSTSIEAMDKAIQEYFGQDKPGDGCIFIATNGKFINIYPELDDHESLAYWLQEQGFSDVDEEAEWFVEAFGYVRCRNSLSQCFIELPIKNITRYQLYSLEEWLETKVSTPTLDIEAPNGEWKNYDLDEYFPEDIIKLIKRCYASGRLYESQAQIDYLPVSDLELFKEYADDILDGFGGMSDADIKSTTKEIHFEGRLAGYIGFSEYEENGSKCLGIGNFMIIERGKGLGSAVIQNIVEKYKNQYDLIYCFVDAKNDGAIRLYKKLGKVYDEDGPNDNGEYYVTFWDNGKWDLDEEFDPPYNEQQVRNAYGEETYQRLIKDPAHLWRMRTGIELIHREPSKKELERIWANWQLMTINQKRKSDEKSKELFGKTNAEHYAELIKTYN